MRPNCEVSSPAYDPPGPMTADSETTNHRIGWRVERRRASRNFGVVLLLIGASFVFARRRPVPAARTTSVLKLALQSLTCLPRWWTSARSVPTVAGLTFAIAIGSALILPVDDGSILLGVVALISGLSIGSPCDRPAIISRAP
jgi:hypothetical protein